MTATLDRAAPPSADPIHLPPEGAIAGHVDPDARPRWSRLRYRWPQLSVTAVALVLNLANLSVNGLGNQYYTAATRSMASSWSSWFFASLDPGDFISVDKPPMFLWIEAIPVRLFGVSTWTVLGPAALAGAAAVALLWAAVDRRFGRVAATIAGAVLAVTPISVAVDRLNLPEPYFLLFLVAAVWAVGRALDAERRALAWIVLAGVLAGCAFNTKMLAAAIPLPALGLGILLATRGWWRKIGHAAAFSVAAVVSGVWWIVVVDLVPASMRPYVGGSSNDTVLDLVLGYNGFGRVNGGAGGGFGGAGGGGGFGGGMGGAGGVMGGSAGPLRLFSDALAGQIAWLLPLAVLGAGVALWRWRSDRVARSLVVVWAGWLALYAVIFSKAAGTFHAYYTAAMAPAIAALVGMGAAAVLDLARRQRWWLAVVPALLAATFAFELSIAGRQPTFQTWARPLAVAVGVAGVAALGIGYAQRSRRLVHAALAAVVAAALVLPASWAIYETTAPAINATLPQAGPRTGQAGSTFGSASSNGDPALAAFLLAQRDGETWDLVTSSAQIGSGIMADQGVSVMALGGFMGTDRAATVSSFADAVAAGQVRYVLVGGGGMAGGTTSAGRGGGIGFAGGGSGMGGGTSTQILNAVSSSCTLASQTAVGSQVPAAYTSTLYDCQGATITG